MLFYLKKVIGMLLMPIPLTVSGIFLGLALLKSFPRVGKSLIAMSAVFLALTSWHPVANQLLRPLEDNFAVFDLAQPVDVVVVLGGCHASDDSVPPVAQLCGTSVFRLLEGLRILSANPDSKLFVSGSSGVNEAQTHAELSRSVAISLGVEAQRIQMFPQANDTRQEAVLMQPYLQDKRFALVSEASHLPRAMRFFQQQGLKPIAAPAARLAPPHDQWKVSAYAQIKSERAFYESIGQLWQWLKGS